MRSSLKSASLIVVATLAATSLVACGSQDPEPVAADSPSPSAQAPTPSAVPSVPPTTTAPPPASTATPDQREPVPSETPEDDENGEFEGQLIIEYPGQPLRRTASSAVDENVEALQIRLNEIGYTIAITGVFNAATETVVKRFQRDSGITPDGIVRANTWAAMFTFEG